MDTEILVLIHGHVIVGVVEQRDEHDVVMTHAAVIRRWGTTRGIGQLARGPTTETVLDPIPAQVRTPVSSIIYAIRTQGSTWDAALAAGGAR